MPSHRVTRSVISVDVEDYFQVEAFSKIVSRTQWDSFSSRVVPNTLRLLDFFDAHSLKGTFFIVGWVAKKYPDLVREIVRRGHEPACHSFWHRLIYTLTPQEFRADTKLAKDCIEQAAGQPIFGYRAPSFSITRRCPWAIDVLAELGFEYDSSIFPVRHDFYGIHDAPRTPFQIMTASGPLTEYPMTTFRFPKTPNLPVGGGGYLRMLPYWYTYLGVQRALKEGLSLISYIHPWEVDPEQPRFEAPLTSRIRHYTNLDKMLDRLAHLVSLSEFVPFSECYPPLRLPVWQISETQRTPQPQLAQQEFPLEPALAFRGASADWDLSGLPGWMVSVIDTLLDSAAMVDLEGLS